MKGELASLAVALLWTVTALLFEKASKRIGSLAVNQLRLSIAFILLSVYCFVQTKSFLPDASLERTAWLAASGVIGFFIGDYFLFKAFVLIGSRVTMLIMASSPVIAALLGFVFLGETLSPSDILAVFAVLVGIAVVVLTRNSDGGIAFAHPLKGVICAFIGAAGQAGGMILSKLGVKGFDPFLATEIRVIAGLAAFLVFAVITKTLVSSVQKYSDRTGVLYTSAGAVCGPFLGVSLSLYAIKNMNIGIATTIMQTVPVFLAVYAIVFLKERIRLIEIAGIGITLAGVGALFLK